MPVKAKSKEAPKVERVCFVIAGEGLTRICRDLVLEHRWREALSILVENLRPGFTHEMAVDVLSGRKKLTGDSTKGMGLALDNGSKEFMKNASFVYDGRAYLPSHGIFMRPYALVVSWSRQDLTGSPVGHTNRWRRTAFPEGRINARTCDSLFRSQYYMDDPSNDMAMPLEVGKGKNREHRVVLWGICPEPPVWMKRETDFQKALDASQQPLDTRGGCELGWEDLSWDRGEAAREEGAVRALESDTDDIISSSTGDETLDAYLKDPEGTTSKLCKGAAIMTGTAPILTTADFNGWLSPSGEFQKCEYGLHSSNAHKIAEALGMASGNSEFQIEQVGWAKLSKGEWYWQGHLLPAQLRRIRGWYADQDREVPKGVEKKLSLEDGYL